jgi:RHS repeat-associated protein
VEYIPYGEVFVEERNSQFSTNFLFNAKELDNETGLYYYGARYLDPTGAMWLSVDPMWEKYAGMSPYNYCMGNPVKLVDPDGREIEEGQSYVDKYKNDVENYKKGAQSSLEKVQHEIQERAQNGMRTRHQEKEAKRLEKRINLYDQVLHEIDVIEKSSQKYRIFEENLGNPLEGNISGFKYNFKTGTIDISLAEPKKIAHELLHAYQFEMGDFSFSRNGRPFYDQQDEIDAYQRGFDIYGDKSYMVGGHTSINSFVRDVYHDLNESGSSVKILNDTDEESLRQYSLKNRCIFRFNGITYKYGNLIVE